MKVWYHAFGTALREGPCVLTLGNFDGVHIGHMALIDRASARSKLLGVPLVAITFDPHPAEIVAPERRPKLLMTLHQRLKALSCAGVDLVWVIPFTYDVSRLDPLTFLSGLHAAIAPIELYVGYGFRFGNERRGDLDSFNHWGREICCKFHNNTLKLYKGERVSSTRIRKALDIGDVELARALLGRPYSLTGPVILANSSMCGINHSIVGSSWEQGQLLRDGIYITEVNLPFISNSLLGITGISRQSTLCGTSTSAIIETHLPDFCAALHVYRAELNFLHSLKDWQNFDNAGGVALRMSQGHRYSIEWYLDYQKQNNLYK